MPTPEKPIEDAIIELTRDNAWLYGKPFFNRSSVELNGFAADLAEHLAKLGYKVFVVDDHTVSWEPTPDEYHIGRRPFA
jgi:hypothetical protein